MTIDPEAAFAIVGMAAVTYATRAGGLWLVQRFPLNHRTRIWLEYIPGTVLVSIVAPTILTSGLPEAIAGVATVLTALRSRNSLLAMAVGILCVWSLRTLVDSSL
jgi:uncharacterized membrane protein